MYRDRSGSLLALAITIITLKLFYIEDFKFNMICLALQIPKDTRFNFCT